jgi:hypothetical protein
MPILLYFDGLEINMTISIFSSFSVQRGIFFEHSNNESNKQADIQIRVYKVYPSKLM